MAPQIVKHLKHGVGPILDNSEENVFEENGIESATGKTVILIYMLEIMTSSMEQLLYAPAKEIRQVHKSAQKSLVAKQERDSTEMMQWKRAAAENRKALPTSGCDEE